MQVYLKTVEDGIKLVTEDGREEVRDQLLINGEELVVDDIDLRFEADDVLVNECAIQVEILY